MRTNKTSAHLLRMFHAATRSARFYICKHAQRFRINLLACECHPVCLFGLSHLHPQNWGEKHWISLCVDEHNISWACNREIILVNTIAKCCSGTVMHQSRRPQSSNCCRIQISTPLQIREVRRNPNHTIRNIQLKILQCLSWNSR